MNRVAVLLSAYNGEKYLWEQINSILDQKGVNLDLYIRDDGSSDDTVDIANSYVSKYDNIILIRNKHNMGLPATLNHCLEYAKSEYIARMDGDDISLPDRLEKEVLFLDNHPEYALVSGWMTCFDENGDWGEVKRLEYPQIMDFVKGTPFCHAPCMMRRSCLNTVGNYSVSEQLRRGQDYYLWYKFYKSGFKGYNIQEPIYKMRDDRNAASRRTLRSSFMSFKVEKEIFDGLGIPKVFYYRLLRGIIVSMIPQPLYILLHKYKNK